MKTIQRLGALALAILLAAGLCGCGVVYVNPYADIPKPVATIKIRVNINEQSEQGESHIREYTLRFTLDPAYAPNTVSNFINLAQSGYYNGLKIDYVYPTYFLRGGDPKGDGTGGPDYTIAGEFTDNGFEFNTLRHERGVISMCRRLNDNNSAGSQFFVMLSTHSEYDGKYTAFGYIDPSDKESLATLGEIEQCLTGSDYQPTFKHVIESVTMDTKGYVYEVIKYGVE